MPFPRTARRLLGATVGLAAAAALAPGGLLTAAPAAGSGPSQAAASLRAGPPQPGSYPASYPWAHAAAGGLFDVTAGAVRTCVRGYLCTATAGFDGPTDRDAAKGCKQHTVSLTPYLGQTITLRFTSREHLIGKVTSFFEDGNVLKVS